MKFNTIKSIYKNPHLSVTEKSIMTSLVIHMNKEKKCRLTLSKIAQSSNIRSLTAGRIINDLVKRNFILKEKESGHTRPATYQIAI
jgi:hypothetical protein